MSGLGSPCVRWDLGCRTKGTFFVFKRRATFSLNRHRVLPCVQVWNIAGAEGDLRLDTP